MIFPTNPIQNKYRMHYPLHIQGIIKSYLSIFEKLGFDSEFEYLLSEELWWPRDCKGNSNTPISYYHRIRSPYPFILDPISGRYIFKKMNSHMELISFPTYWRLIIYTHKDLGIRRIRRLKSLRKGIINFFPNFTSIEYKKQKYIGYTVNQTISGDAQFLNDLLQIITS